jgi:hypothetical protein
VDRIVGMRDGRTSTEILRRRDASGAALSEEEYVIVDRGGRLTLPQAYVDRLALRERARARLNEDHVSIYPDDATQSQAEK